MKYFKKIEGEHIYLSPMNVDDAELFVKWLNNPEITKYLSNHNSIVSLIGEKAFLERVSKEGCNLSIVEKETDKLIGTISFEKLDYKNGTAELGIFIGEEDKLSKGYGSEAIKLLTNYGFQELRLHAIYLEVLSNNPRAKRAYEKCGFVECGILHESIYRNGQYIDKILMELINK